MRGLLWCVAVAAAAVWYRQWHVEWGATSEESAATLPGDDVPVSRVRNASDPLDHHRCTLG